MARLSIPSSIDAAPAGSRSRLQSVSASFGSVPNLFRVMGNSPAALGGYFDMSAALTRGRLSAATRERIALAISELNRSDYCLSVHAYIGSKLTQLDDAEIIANRSGASNDIEANAAVRFAVEVARARGHVKAGQVEAVRKAGYDDAQVVEIVQLVAMTIFANYLSEVAKTEIDFPIIHARKAA
jgi:uncharacterized peroxidase-related enzyme